MIIISHWLIALVVARVDDEMGHLFYTNERLKLKLENFSSSVCAFA